MIRVTVVVEHGATTETTVRENPGPYILPVLMQACRAAAEQHAAEIPAIQQALQTLASTFDAFGTGTDPT